MTIKNRPYLAFAVALSFSVAWSGNAPFAQDALLLEEMNQEGVSTAVVTALNAEAPTIDGTGSQVVVRTDRNLRGPKAPGTLSLRYPASVGRDRIGARSIDEGATFLAVFRFDAASGVGTIESDWSMILLPIDATTPLPPGHSPVRLVVDLLDGSLRADRPTAAHHALNVLGRCCGALGNATIARVEDLSEDSDPKTRALALTALYWQGQAEDRFGSALELLKDHGLGKAQKLGLLRPMLHGPTPVGPGSLRTLIEDTDDPGVQSAASCQLNGDLDPRSIGAFAVGSASTNPSAQYCSVAGLTKILGNKDIATTLSDEDREAAVSVLLEAARGRNRTVVERAIRALQSLTSEPVFDVLRILSDGENPHLAATALAYRLDRGDRTALEPAMELIEEWSDSRDDSKLWLAHSLETSLRTTLAPEVEFLNMLLLESQDLWIRRAAAAGLATGADETSADVLVGCLAWDDLPTKQYCVEALVRIAGQGPDWSEFIRDPNKATNEWHQWVGDKARQ